MMEKDQALQYSPLIDEDERNEYGYEQAMLQEQSHLRARIKLLYFVTSTLLVVVSWLVVVLWLRSRHSTTGTRGLPSDALFGDSMLYEFFRMHMESLQVNV
jgi:hypothetical protein